MSAAAARPIHWLYLSLSIAFQATAVVLGKTAALRLAAATVRGFLTNPWYVAGIGCLVVQALFWQLVLRRMRLTVAYLVTSLSYLVILAASRIFFAERINAFNVVGSFIIVAGVYLVINEQRA